MGNVKRREKPDAVQLGVAFRFSRLSLRSVISYTVLPMTKLNQPTKLTVIWQVALDTDPHAMLKAVALLFHRRVPLSTSADLTNKDKTLMCEQPQKM